jgi:hypothetical protein
LGNENIGLDTKG